MQVVLYPDHPTNNQEKGPLPCPNIQNLQSQSVHDVDVLLNTGLVIRAGTWHQWYNLPFSDGELVEMLQSNLP